jgi:hypothetical protein
VTLKTCFRCDWQGKTTEPDCPNCGERPLYVVEKNPKLRGKQGQYMVMAMDGRVLKRGHDLRTVLRVLEPNLSVVT